MIHDKDLNNLKRGLETYFTYNPLGPSSITLNPETAKKLLNLLKNIDEIRVCRIIRTKDLEFFPNDELMQYIKSDMATAIANELIDKGYVKIFNEDNTVDPDMRHIYGSVITIKMED